MNLLGGNCAHLQADAIREVHFELPEEDSEKGMCGKHKKSTHGTRDAAQNGGYAYSQFMVDEDLRKGPSSPCVFWHPDRELRCVVHGDEFIAL